MSSEHMNPVNRGGTWLAAGGILLAVILPVHGPTHADLSVQMQHIADGHGQWAAVHWIAAIALLLLAGAGAFYFVEALVERRRQSPAGAWLLFAMGSFLTIETAVVEATAISATSNNGDLDGFLVWWPFASGLGNGFMVVALATALIAFKLANTDRSQIPSWLCWVGVVVALLSAIGWSLGQHFRMPIGGPLWFAATLTMALWLAWFGFKTSRASD